MAAIGRPWERIPARPPAERIRANLEAAEYHAGWVRRHAPDTPFRPEDHPEGSDYNLHWVDVDASGQALDELAEGYARILGQ